MALGEWLVGNRMFRISADSPGAGVRRSLVFVPAKFSKNRLAVLKCFEKWQKS